MEVSKNLGRCLRCIRTRTKVSSQLMADLPAVRITPNNPPIHAVGVDYFGPILVRQGRSTPKRYGCLFTCLASRAVHVEVAYDLTTSCFINAYRRFCSRRGSPSEIYSDNGSNLVGAQRELKTALSELDQTDIMHYMLVNGTKWNFNPPTATHMGGIWERMVRSVKSILKPMLDKRLVTDEMLQTLMAEVERIINSRPLTPVSYNPQDEDASTPNHLLVLRSNNNTPPGRFSAGDVYSRSRWRGRCNI